VSYLAPDDASEPDSSQTQVIFCLVAPPEAQLEIYRSELQTFCKRQVEAIKEKVSICWISWKHFTNFDKTFLQSFEDKLKLWPFHALGFFSRVVSNLGIKVTYLLEAVCYLSAVLKKKINTKFATGFTTVQNQC
jgi:hypothetical protein